VERGRGDLRQIVESLSEFCDFADDLSLIAITWTGGVSDGASHSVEFESRMKQGRRYMRAREYAKAICEFEEACFLKPRDEAALRALGRAYFRSGDFERAAEVFTLYLEFNPQNDEFLLYTAHAHKERREYAIAADYGERLRLRNPTHIRNLVHLADIYRLAGDLDRAEKLVRQALATQPENPDAIKLSQLLFVVV